MIAVLDSSAPSFCYYRSASSETPEIMTESVFARTVRFAKENGLFLNIICNTDGLGEEQRMLMEAEGVPYLWYMPANGKIDVEKERKQSCVPIVNSDEPESIDCLETGAHLTAVLRVRKNDLEKLPELWERLAAKVYRVVLVTLELEKYELSTLKPYDDALSIVSKRLENLYTDGKELEFNAISDRMALSEPAHCSAGVDHVTVSPNGELFICPGFANRGEASIGDLDSGPDIPNHQLLSRERAPICSICDAYHCRRCVDLNQMSTLEVNTPPWQLCRVSHLDREASRVLLDKLQSNGILKPLKPIVDIEYNDPLDAFLNFNKRIEVPVFYPAEDKKTSTKNKRPEDLPHDKPRHLKLRGAGSLLLSKSLLEAKPIGRVTAEERDEIRELHLKRVATADLFLGLATETQNELDSNTLYDDLILDMGDVSLNFQKWWDTVVAKYNWRRSISDKWRINFDSCDVFIEA